LSDSPLVKIEELRQEKGFLEDQLQRALKELKAYQLQVSHCLRRGAWMKPLSVI
jgi:hypothetical protein